MYTINNYRLFTEHFSNYVYYDEEHVSSLQDAIYIINLCKPIKIEYYINKVILCFDESITILSCDIKNFDLKVKMLV
mgnify:CR=1 FL=1